MFAISDRMNLQIYVLGWLTGECVKDVMYVAEIVDTQTGEQIAALIDSREKGRPLGEYYKWENAKAIMDEWAAQFYRRLREARAY